MIVARSWPNDPFDTNKSDGSPHGRAFVTAERDGYFRLRPGKPQGALDQSAAKLNSNPGAEPTVASIPGAKNRHR